MLEGGTDNDGFSLSCDGSSMPRDVSTLKTNSNRENWDYRPKEFYGNGLKRFSSNGLGPSQFMDTKQIMGRIEGMVLQQI